MGPGSSSPRNCWQFGSLTESSQQRSEEDPATIATLQVGKPRRGRFRTQRPRGRTGDPPRRSGSRGWVTCICCPAWRTRRAPVVLCWAAPEPRPHFLSRTGATVPFPRPTPVSAGGQHPLSQRMRRSRCLPHRPGPGRVLWLAPRPPWTLVQAAPHGDPCALHSGDVTRRRVRRSFKPLLEPGWRVRGGVPALSFCPFSLGRLCGFVC